MIHKDNPVIKKLEGTKEVESNKDLQYCKIIVFILTAPLVFVVGVMVGVAL